MLQTWLLFAQHDEVFCSLIYTTSGILLFLLSIHSSKVGDLKDQPRIQTLLKCSSVIANTGTYTLYFLILIFRLDTTTTKLKRDRNRTNGLMCYSDTGVQDRQLPDLRHWELFDRNTQVNILARPRDWILHEKMERLLINDNSYLSICLSSLFFLQNYWQTELKLKFYSAHCTRELKS